jgi:hypothetical protein
MPTMKGKQIFTNAYLDPQVHAALKKGQPMSRTA